MANKPKGDFVRQLLCQMRAWHVDLVLCGIKRSATTESQVSSTPAIIFSPHQDDETLGCAGLIALKRELSVPVQVVFLTNGDAYLGPGDAAIGRQRQQEALQALEILGVAAEQVMFWGYPDGQLAGLIETQQAKLRQDVMQVLAQYEQAEVYVPHAQDRHLDHEVTCAIVQSAIAEMALPHQIFQYPIWIFWKTPLLLRLRLKQLKGWRRLDIQSVAKQKQAAIAAHGSQITSLPPGFLKRFRRAEEFFY
jgi:LmbE family N-acetylglucosaminyl deacetylase